MLNVIARLALLVSSLPSASSIDPDHAINITVYHVNPKHFGPKPVNMDTGDVAGDMFFDFHNALVAPLECPQGAASGHGCSNPEVLSPDLMLNKVVLEVDSRFSGYARCNIGVNGSSTSGSCPVGTYCCVCGGHGSASTPCNKTVGMANILETHGARSCSQRDPAWACYKDNSAKKFTTQNPGFWYSSLKEGYCGDKPNYYSDPCTWRVVSVPKIVTKKCQNNVFLGAVEAQGKSCFSGCGADAKNTSSPCWVNCFYETVLGPDAGKAGGTISGMALEDLLKAWKAPFESDDPTKGGCPNVGADWMQTNIVV